MILLRICVLLGLVSCGYTYELPEDYPKCNEVTEENEVSSFEKCVVQAALAWKPLLLNGLPDLGIPPITKFVIPKAEVHQVARAFSFDVMFTNTTVKGLELYQFDKFNYNLKAQTHFAKMRFPKLYAEGQFSLRGQFIGQQMNRTGPFNGTAADTTVTIKLFTKIVNRKGTRYLKIKDSQIDVQIGKAEGNFANLFGDVEVLNKAVTEFLKDSTQEVFEAVKPDVVNTLRALVASTVNKVVDSLPYESIFPPKPKS